jgi:hypothetical protein
VFWQREPEIPALRGAVNFSIRSIPVVSSPKFLHLRLPRGTDSVCPQCLTQNLKTPQMPERIVLEEDNGNSSRTNR